MKYLFSFVLILFALTDFTWSQNPIGNPFINNFSRKVYQGGTENWDIHQDNKRGIMYFANFDGLLEYDGDQWQIYELNNRTIARSLLILENRIYVGGQGDFGFFAPDSLGSLKYHSLIPLITVEADRNFDDIWNIHNARNKNMGLIFVSPERIFVFKEERISVIEPLKNQFEFSFYPGRKNLFVYEKGIGLLTINTTGTLDTIPGGYLFEYKNHPIRYPLIAVHLNRRVQ
ncbi:MAG: hypothetical protein AAFP19_11605 [Bacteroidota bacterium]